MGNSWKDYPRYRPARGKPLFDTGDREGHEEIRDGAKWIGGKVAVAAQAVGRGLKKLVTRKKHT